ncbi:MAG: TatA/E family twin arginine-targeting protein translocase [Cyanobacteria bacterium]|jgi:sec-independent protein translocase protein TatA|uniref:TatA/E family twin arginine-targeting protein translocase n=1 Tax=unclassified Vulcanococcus TaxID=2766969 RepID=UPI000D79D10B|nr:MULTISPECIES: TatA/E family twin arginine-targeting protein translocase [unclassified Vulcanococcus]MDA0965126.1 TatA/E family twin arginine-targeting protein translocase [Cyanobacteriota bacterium]MDA1157759.1 TatA/E family twin arginine-targeting protein translocase [Cyanobacteriota bacterium]NCV92583.1 TatA/E family twin arginine-targeting protein translocase [Synechococcaceae bacterium WB7_3xG_012]PWL21892.1 MAG: twin-arginine translocase TatA/TatE family subunit [Synechococcus sp. XM-24
MNVFGIGLPEMAVIAAVGLLVFGPKRLPELGRTLGKTLKGFQSASKEFEQEFRKAVDTVEAEVTQASAEPQPQLKADDEQAAG